MRLLDCSAHKGDDVGTNADCTSLQCKRLSRRRQFDEEPRVPTPCFSVFSNGVSGDGAPTARYAKVMIVMFEDMDGSATLDSEGTWLVACTTRNRTMQERGGLSSGSQGVQTADDRDSALRAEATRLPGLDVDKDFEGGCWKKEGLTLVIASDVTQVTLIRRRRRRRCGNNSRVLLSTDRFLPLLFVYPRGFSFSLFFFPCFFGFFDFFFLPLSDSSESLPEWTEPPSDGGGESPPSPPPPINNGMVQYAAGLWVLQNTQ
jgi:hypothetical protein